MESWASVLILLYFIGPLHEGRGTSGGDLMAPLWRDLSRINDYRFGFPMKKQMFRITARLLMFGIFKPQLHLS